MELYYTDKENVFSTYLRIIGHEAHHISRVMRHKSGDLLYVTDGEGNEYQTIIKKFVNKSIEASIINKSRNTRETVTKVSLAQSLIKGNHLDLIVEKTTELGVHKIVPIVTERTIVSLTEKKLKRYQNIMLAAMKSSTRTFLPHIEKLIKFDNLLETFPAYDLVVLAYEDEKILKLSDIITNNMYKHILLIVGPEGGFTKNEIKQAQSFGAKCFSLGARRLRAETAAISALSILLYQLKEM